MEELLFLKVWEVLVIAGVGLTLWLIARWAHDDPYEDLWSSWWAVLIVFGTPLIAGALIALIR